MAKKNTLILVDENYLKNKIYIIRGQKVMLDSDLAEIYGYSTKAFNQQVQRNIEKFDKDFMFKISIEEIPISLRSQNVTLNKNNNMQGVHYKYSPFVFTEQGVYMLMTVLKGDLAIKQSKTLIRLFKRMKDYIFENKDLLPYQELKNLELRTDKLEEDNKNIKTDLNRVIHYFEDPSTYKHFLILNGMKLEADIAYKKIIGLARKSIIYIDDYINLKTLEILSTVKNNIKIIIISDNKSKDRITSFMVDDFAAQNNTNELTIYKSNNKCHDRFIIIDFNTRNEKIYHCGSSLKDAGNKITTINKLDNTEIYKDAILKLLDNDYLQL